MEEAQKIEDFYGVYLLCSQSSEKRYRNRCYIGYTVNPNRRINQHNRGMDFGGARKTNNKGPWVMVMIIHGFPNNITALQFEWAWQWPSQSSRLKMIQNLGKKKRNESHFDYNFRILSEMLRIGPWNRLPLKIRWLSEEHIKNFPPDKIPPMHMQICHGHVVIKKKSKQNDLELITNKNNGIVSELQQLQTIIMPTTQLECHLCMQVIENPKRSKINCLNPKCKLTCHIICLANQYLEPGHYIPIEGDCPICEIHFLWGDLLRKKNGCNDLEDCTEEDENDHDDEYNEYKLDNKNVDANDVNDDILQDDNDDDDFGKRKMI